jgi:hypothetical protein
MNTLPGHSANTSVKHDYLPPLLRGIGTTLILIGTVVAFVSVRRDVEQHTSNRRASALTSTLRGSPQPTLDLLATDLQQVRSEMREESVAEEVFENRWFESLGLLGAGIASATFYIESLMRRSKSPSSKASADQAQSDSLRSDRITSPKPR